ncbi:hypothetical protein ACFZ8E_07350 [Methylobacterium sp. HMF5984]|uniref:hypothetical protein n=1 Tax=Methylobacterium sp. HMF5984 TaxID=3367370 RepID=UPI00385556C7
MTDLSQTIAPKSDQLNADDLIGGPRTITVTRVSAMKEPDQPIAVYFEGDGGKPYKPGKSMRRVLVRVWGNDGATYVGRRMTLYRDDAVQFGGAAVGGIRISHMSDIARDVTMALTVTRASRKPFTVKPLPVDRGPAPGKEPTAPTGAPKPTLSNVARDKARLGREAYAAWTDRLTPRQVEALGEIRPDLDRLLDDADARDEETFPGDIPNSEAA